MNGKHGIGSTTFALAFCNEGYVCIDLEKVCMLISMY